MKKRYGLVHKIVGLIGLTCVFGMQAALADTTTLCPPIAPALAPEAVPQLLSSAKNKGFLYTVTKDGQTSWVYGTVHVGNQNTVFPGPQLLDVLKQSKALALELDMSIPEDMLKALQAASSADINQQLLSPERTQVVVAAAKAGCMEIERLKPLPVVLQAITLVLNEAKHEGWFTDYSQESFLTGFASSTKRKVHGLESMEEQLNALMGRNASELALMVDKILKEMKLTKNKKTMADMMSMWLGSDVEKLNNYYNWCECINSDLEKAFMARVIDVRNRTMLERAIKLHDQYQGGLLIAVGSLHLMGSTGLLKGFETMGYKVGRVY